MKKTKWSSMLAKQKRYELKSTCKVPTRTSALRHHSTIGSTKTMNKSMAKKQD